MLARYVPLISDALLGFRSVEGVGRATSTALRCSSSSATKDDGSGVESASASTSSPADAGQATSTSSKPSGLRKLSDVLGQPLSAALAAQAQDEPTDADLEALFGSGPATASTAAQPREEAKPEPASQSVPAAEIAVDPLQKISHGRYGYAALGGVVPAAEAKTDFSLGSMVQSQPRLHPKRIFMPGMTYDASDLNAYTQATTAKSSLQRRAQRMMPSAQEVFQWADYKNVAFLEQFLTPAGRLLPRRRTKLPIHAHVHVMRQIKVARVMGLMAHEARLEKEHLRQVREKELHEATERGLL